MQFELNLVQFEVFWHTAGFWWRSRDRKTTDFLVVLARRLLRLYSALTLRQHVHVSSKLLAFSIAGANIRRWETLLKEQLEDIVIANVLLILSHT
jgi:hypothetical protein